MRIDPTAIAPIMERPISDSPPVRTSIVEQDAAIVTLSSAGAAIQASSASEASVARLEALRLQIERGEYTIDLDKLASRIADDELARTKEPR
jgi:anti-sigma28 factor (negative regulator of flagellin synthesis)